MKETKELLEFAFELGGAYKKAKEDGKVDYMDIPHFMPAFMGAVAAFENVSDVKAEFAAMDAEQSAELMKFAADKLGEAMEEEKVIARIEAGLKVGLAIADLVKLI